MGKTRRESALRSLKAPTAGDRPPATPGEGPGGEVTAFFRTTRASTIVECDDALSTMLDVSAAMLIGKPFAVFVDLWDRNQFRERVVSLPADARSEDWRFRLCVRGRTIPVVATVAAMSCVTATDSRPGLRWKLQEDRTTERFDVSALKPERMQEIRDQGKEEVLGMIAHEVGQPLAAIVAYARGCLIRSKAEALSGPELERALEQIVDQALRAGAIIKKARNPKVQS